MSQNVFGSGISSHSTKHGSSAASPTAPHMSLACRPGRAAGPKQDSRKHCSPWTLRQLSPMQGMVTTSSPG